MPWHLVVISKRRTDNASAASLIAKLVDELHNPEASDDRGIRVYHQSDADTDRLWLSPATAARAPRLLALFGSTPCATKPELVGFEKIQFPYGKFG
jgi:hypothetical protein